MSGLLDTTPFQNAPFVVTVQADTDGVFPLIKGILMNPAISHSISISGVGAGTFTVPMFGFIDTNAGLAAISNASISSSIALQNNTLAGWELITPIGPLTGTGGAGGAPLQTSFGTLFMQGGSELTFVAGDIAGVPEPATGAVAGIAVAATMLRRKYLRQRSS